MPLLLIWLLQMWYYFGKSLMEKEEVGKAVRCFQDSQAGEGLRASKEAGSEEGMWVLLTDCIRESGCFSRIMDAYVFWS